jgi:hypothetical protein
MSSTNVQNIPNDKVIIVACPVSSSGVRHVAGVGVLMAVDFIESYDQYDTGERSNLQFLLNPKQAREICEALRKSVQALELGAALKKSVQNPAKLLRAPSSDEPVIA